MAPRIFLDLSRVDQEHIEFPREAIRRVNPQRYEFEQLDGVFCVLKEEGLIVGYKDVRSDEFWVRGHVPGRPLLPGVLMIEAAAQLCSVYHFQIFPAPGFFGFGAVDGVKFRSGVVPGDRLILIAKAVKVRPRRSIFETQGVVGEKLCFEGTITGIYLSGSDPGEQGREF